MWCMYVTPHIHHTPLDLSSPYLRGLRPSGVLRTRADRRRREEGDRPDQREATRVPWLVAGYRGGREGGWVRGGLRLSGEKVNKSPLEFLIIVRLLGGETPNCFIAQARKSDQAKLMMRPKPGQTQANFYC